DGHAGREDDLAQRRADGAERLALVAGAVLEYEHGGSESGHRDSSFDGVVAGWSVASAASSRSRSALSTTRKLVWTTIESPSVAVGGAAAEVAAEPPVALTAEPPVAPAGAVASRQDTEVRPSRSTTRSIVAVLLPTAWMAARGIAKL